MKIRALTSMSRNGVSVKNGETIDVPDDEGKALCDAQLAEVVAEPVAAAESKKK